MKVDYKFEWYVQEIPPRCRKPRDVLHTKTVKVDIPDFQGEEVDKNAPGVAAHKTGFEKQILWQLPDKGC